MSGPVRCNWCLGDDLYLDYHDKEWGAPLHDDGKLFEFLVLEGAQAGLSWITVLKKRPAYREAFDGFDFNRVAKYDEDKVSSLLANPGIIRNELKIRSAIRNARAFIRVREEFGTFNDYIWGFVEGKPIQNAWPDLSRVPAGNPPCQIKSPGTSNGAASTSSDLQSSMPTCRPPAWSTTILRIVSGTVK